MPSELTYPGVYVEEIPSGVRTIVGVSTSITAFIGRAERGPVNRPTTIGSFGDFVRQFGELDSDYPMSFAVNDFFQNGGREAVIVRLTHTVTNGGTAAAASTLNVDSLHLVARSPGEWADNLYAYVDYDGLTDEIAQRYGLATAADLFNLTVSEVVNGEVVRSERFINLAFASTAGARRVDRVLDQSSSLVRLATTGAPPAPDLPAARPAATTLPASGTPPANPGDPFEWGFEAGGGANGDGLADTDYDGDEDAKTGLFALADVDFNLLCLPPDTLDGDLPTAVWSSAMTYCVRRRAMLIVDPPIAWGANQDPAVDNARNGLSSLNLTGQAARNAALYYPRVRKPNPTREGQIEVFAACGMIAGVMARTDATRGVWKAPAGIDAALQGAAGLQVTLNDRENGRLNPLGINVLRNFPIIGNVVWGSRTLRGADQLADEYKYVPVRRLALYIEESLYRGTQWIVFEPNDEPLWAQIRLNIGAFMQGLFRQGAFQGTTPRDAYFVKCDSETTTQYDIDRGIVNIVVGFAPLKPAEFVVIKLQQIARTEA